VGRHIAASANFEAGTAGARVGWGMGIESRKAKGVKAVKNGEGFHPPQPTSVRGSVVRYPAGSGAETRGPGRSPDRKRTSVGLLFKRHRMPLVEMFVVN